MTDTNKKIVESFNKAILLEFKAVNALSNSTVIMGAYNKLMCLPACKITTMESQKTVADLFRDFNIRDSVLSLTSRWIMDATWTDAEYREWLRVRAYALSVTPPGYFDQTVAQGVYNNLTLESAYEMLLQTPFMVTLLLLSTHGEELVATLLKNERTANRGRSNQ